MSSLAYYVKLYFVALIVFLGVDAVWLGKIAPKFYSNNIGHLLAEQPNLIAAGVFYGLNIIGILVFAVVPALNKQSILLAIGLGALYGFITYATYDLTNLATLKDWPLKVTIIDIVWGSFLTGTVSTLTYLIAERFFGG